MEPDTDLALDALTGALDALLVAVVALDGVHAVEVPVEAVDVVLGADDIYLEIRSELSLLMNQVAVLLGEGHADLFLALEAAGKTITVASIDAAFRLGIAAAARRARP